MSARPLGAGGWFRGPLGADTDAAGGHHEDAVLVPVLGDRLGEDQLAGPAALLLPRLASAGGRAQDVAHLHRRVVLVVLLGVEAATSAATSAATAPAGLVADGRLGLGTGAHEARRVAARPEPRLADARAQAVGGIELG